MFHLYKKISLIVFFSISTVLFYSTVSLAAEKSKVSEQQMAVLMVNINKASAEDIADVLTGVGLNKAKVIVEYRNKIGSFKNIEQLLEVKGIGPATIEKNRHKLQL